MSKPVPHLELRPTGFFWRRRVPVAISSHYSNQVFCFPLKTNVLREAAVVAPRITAIADTCFRAEIDVPPDVMTRLLVTYARLEIEAADRLRALLGPRTREAAEASLSLETAIRSSLRDAIFLCEREPAFRAVESTARYLGIEIAGDDADLSILADRMLRLMLEVSDERERRARGQFCDRQPYLDLALTGGLPDQHALTAPAAAEVPRPVGDAGVNAAPPPLFISQRKQPLPNAMTATGQPAAETAPADALMTPPQRAGDIVAQRELRTDHVLFGEDGLTIRFSAPSAPAVDSSRTVQDLPRLFDLWFAHKATGTVKQGNLEVTDENLAETFLRNGDTIRSTRRILADFFGTRPASDISDVDWQAFVTFMRRIPKNHGKSPAKRHQPLALAITEADKADAARCAQAQAAEDHRARQSGSAAVKLKRSQVTALVDRLSARTVQRHQMTIASVLDHAVEVGLIPQHGFRGYILKDKTVAILKSATADTTRLLWGSEFEALLATEKWTSDKTRIDDHLYWTPLIARMHGLRSEEILQLEASNIRVMDGIAFFDILQGTGQSLKSDNARRMVPIHSQLLELGFLDLVERQRSLGQKRLFAGAKRARTAKLSYTANFTKKFTYYRKSRKVYNARMDLHALRTTFNSTLVAARVPDTARRYLMGHVNPDVGITNYLPEGFPLTTLKDIIEERRFDLSMITRRFAKVDIRPRGPVLAVSNGQALPRARAGRAAS